MSKDVIQIPGKSLEQPAVVKVGDGLLFRAGPVKIIIRLPNTEQLCVVMRGIQHFGDKVEVHGPSTMFYDSILPFERKKVLHTRTRAALKLI